MIAKLGFWFFHLYTFVYRGSELDQNLELDMNLDKVVQIFGIKKLQNSLELLIVSELTLTESTLINPDKNTINFITFIFAHWSNHY